MTTDDDLERQVRAALATATVDIAHDLIDHATNFVGQLRPEVRERLMALITDPSPDTWDDAQSIILNAEVGLGRTLWQAMLRVDPSCPRQGAPEGRGARLTPTQRWGGYWPAPVDVLAAIRWAVLEP